jgi:hypothetical protein
VFVTLKEREPMKKTILITGIIAVALSQYLKAGTNPQGQGASCPTTTTEDGCIEIALAGYVTANGTGYKLSELCGTTEINETLLGCGKTTSIPDNGE